MTQPGGFKAEFLNEDETEMRCPKNCAINFCKANFPPPQAPKPAAPCDDCDTVDDTPDPSPPALPKSPYEDTGLYNCATLNSEEKENLRKISCKTTGI